MLSVKVRWCICEWWWFCVSKAPCRPQRQALTPRPTCPSRPACLCSLRSVSSRWRLRCQSSNRWGSPDESKSYYSSAKNENLLKMCSSSGLPRCRCSVSHRILWDCGGWTSIPPGRSGGMPPRKKILYILKLNSAPTQVQCANLKKKAGELTCTWGLKGDSILFIVVI